MRENWTVIVKKLYNKRMAKPNLLVVDDESDSVDALERLFRKKFKVFKATSGIDALKVVKKEPLSIIISDQRMPKMTGVEFLKESIELQPEAIRILLTGYTDVESVIGSINSGEVYKYVTKPWDPVDFSNTIEKAYEKFHLRQELREKNKSLEAALKELQQLDASKSQFMILINHELKTPLTVMTSFLDLLKETKLDDEQNLYIKKIEQARDQFQYITERVLNLVSAQTGQEKVKKEKVDLVKVTTDLLDTMKSEQEKKTLTVNINCKKSSHKTDLKKVSTVIQELAKNALTFAKDKTSVDVTISESDDGTKFTISNESKKVSKDQLEKVLKPFSLNEDIMNHSKGLGVGLSLAQALLEQMGSTLQLDWQDGRFSASFVLV